MYTADSISKKSSVRRVTMQEAQEWYATHGGIGVLPEGEYLLVSGKQHTPSTGRWFLVAEKHGLAGLWEVGK